MSSLPNQHTELSAFMWYHYEWEAEMWLHCEVESTRTDNGESSLTLLPVTQSGIGLLSYCCTGAWQQQWCLLRHWLCGLSWFQIKRNRSLIYWQSSWTKVQFHDNLSEAWTQDIFHLLRYFQFSFSAFFKHLNSVFPWIISYVNELFYFICRWFLLE